MRTNRTKWHFLAERENLMGQTTARVMCGKTVNLLRVNVKYDPSIIDGDREHECAGCRAAYDRRLARVRL